MTERLSEINARIDGITQLGAVVNAMRGIAAARAQQARTQLGAVDTYASGIAAAIGTLLPLIPDDTITKINKPARTALVLFCAEEGFAGAFSQLVLASVKSALASSEIFLIGTRGISAILELGYSAEWTAALPSHSKGIPKMADRISDTLYTRIATGEIDRLEAVFSLWQPGHAISIERVSLFPFDLSTLSKPKSVQPPMMGMAPAALIEILMADYMHAQLCRAALHAFAAENEARMEAMAAARRQVQHQLASLQSRQRTVRQEAITEEVIELAAGESAGKERA